MRFDGGDGGLGWEAPWDQNGPFTTDVKCSSCTGQYFQLLQGANGIKAESVNGIKAAGILTPFLSVNLDTWHYFCD